MILIKMYDVYEYLCCKHNCGVDQLMVSLEDLKMERENRRHNRQQHKLQQIENRRNQILDLLTESQSQLQVTDPVFATYIKSGKDMMNVNAIFSVKLNIDTRAKMLFKYVPIRTC